MNALRTVVTALGGGAVLARWLPLVLIVVPLAILTVKLVRQLRSRKKAAAGPARARLDLVRVWKEFRRRTPVTQRRALPLFQPFIVVGDVGAGKSALVDRHVDWRGQSAQFHPSHVDDPRLQIYRGTHAIVQELSAAVLDDTSPAARAALKRLWRPFARGRAPGVVIALDAARLLRAAPEQLARRAQVVRGKLDLLAEVVRRPVEVTVVITKADQMKGYLDLAAALRARRTALELHPQAADGSLELERGFARFARLLPAVLADTNAAAYLDALTFFAQLPELIRPLDVFLRALCSADPITPEPRLATVALQSSEEAGAALFSPFAAAISDADVRRFRPLRRHVLGAAAVAAAAALYLVAGYASARGRIDEANRRLDAVLEAPRDAEAQAAWLGTLRAGRRSLARRLLPRFFAGDGAFVDAEVRRRFVDGVRERLLLPRLGPGGDGERGAARLYALTLLHASSSNRLGKLVRAHADQWAEMLAVPEWLVRSYIDAAEARLPPPAIDGRALAEEVTMKLSLDTPALARLLSEVQARLTQPAMNAAELQALKQLAAPARLDALALAERANLVAALALLKEETGIDVGDAARAPAATSGPSPGAVAELAALVEHSELDAAAGSNVDVAGLVAALGALAVTKPQGGRPITIAFDGQRVTVDPAAWQQLLVRSRATLLVHGFAARPDDDLQVLFANPGAYAPVIVSGGRDGCAFSGGGRVDGVYSAKALTDHLLPALAQLPTLLPKLPLGDADKQQLGDFVADAVGDYASDYVEQYRALFASLTCRAGSPEKLRAVTAALQSSTSPLRSALREVTRNTALNLPTDNAAIAPLGAIVDEFAALRALAPPSGPAPQLDGWIAVMRALQAALDGRDATPPDDKEPEDALRRKLTPLGRVALAIYRSDPDSMKQQVERWLTSGNIDTEWWPQFVAPVDAAYGMGRREVEKTVAQSWHDLVQADVEPLVATFPFARDAAAPATEALVDAALAPKQAFWSGFEDGIAPVLVPARDGWRAREGRTSPLLPSDLLPTANRMSALAALLYDKTGKPKPLVVRVRPLPLARRAGAGNDASLVAASYLQAGGATVYGFNQRAEWTTLKIEWWHADSAAVGIAVGSGEARRSYRAVSVLETPWSLWRLLQRASASGHVFTWQVPDADGRTTPVQFEIEEEPWARFALR